MERGIFYFIWRYSARDQLTLVGLSLLVLPVLYFTFELPKTIVNQAIGGDGGFPKHILGRDLEQVPYLLVLCGLFLLLVLVNLGLKYLTATYRYRVGDRLLRRLRFDLVERLMRFPPQEFRNTSSGQVVSMVAAETSTLGLFIAEAFAVPAIALGTLATIVFFMFMQDWLMGVAAIALLPVQLYLIPRFQRRINRLQREEVQVVRQLSQRVGDVVAGIHEIHGHDTSQYELADVSSRLGTIFQKRVQISSNRYIVNILNAFFSQLTPFFFLSIGGYLVISGEISLGALVAVLAAYKDMYAPWKDLIDYYQKAADARVKHDQLREFFTPPGLLARAVLTSDPSAAVFTDGELTVNNLVVESDDGMRPVDDASVTLPLPAHVLVVAGGGSGGEEFAHALARRLYPRAGRLSVGDINIPEQPDSVTGRKIGYVGPDIYMSGGTLRNALIYPLLHRPAQTDHDTHEHREAIREAVRAGNSEYDTSVDWIDYAAAGCINADELTLRIVEILKRVGLDKDVYDFGLRRAINPTSQPELARQLIVAREHFRARVKREGLSDFIEPFDADKYLRNASVAENILFGTPVGTTFSIENLGANQHVLRVMEDVGLTHELLLRGRKLAATMLEIFRDLPSAHEFFNRFSFINGDDLPTFEAAIRRADAQGLDSLDHNDRALLLALPFKLIVNQHHVGLIDSALQERLLHARKIFAETLPDHLRHTVQFFGAETYNAAGSIADNVVFGKIAANRAESSSVVGRLLYEVLNDLGLHHDIIVAGLSFDIGVSGARLSASQRQRLAFARALLKRPELLVVNDALAPLDPNEQDSFLTGLREEMADRTLILVEATDRRATMFEHVLHMDRGKISTTTEYQPTALSNTSAHTNTEANVDLNDIVAILQRIPFFAGIDRSRLKLLAFTSERTVFEEGQFVFRQGERGDNAYVIIEGEAEVILESIGGPRIVAVLGVNQVFGEMALLSKAPRTTGIRARTATKCVVIASDVFLRLVEENSAIAANMTRTLAARLAATLHEYGQVSASHDATTNLPTQHVFLESARQAQARRKRQGQDTAIMVFDLESLSHAVLNTARENKPVVMKQAAQSMRQCLRGTDVLAHLSGDRYGVVLTDYRGEQDARTAAGRIVAALHSPFKIGGQTIELHPTIEFRLALLDDHRVDQTLERCWGDEITRFVLAS